MRGYARALGRFFAQREINQSLVDIIAGHGLTHRSCAGGSKRRWSGVNTKLILAASQGNA